jgi:1-deoxy-D-xylulose-5-phosphate reductoisomerase
MKQVSVLGSAGSIGIQALDVIRLHPDKFRVAALASGSNLDLLEAQVREFCPALVSCGNENVCKELKIRLRDYSKPIDIVHSKEGLELASTYVSADIVVGGLPGSVGLRPAFLTVAAGKDLALATKEVLVMAGSLFMESVKASRTRLLPVDSEQSAIFQCLEGNQGRSIKKIHLTASGGPFLKKNLKEINRMTREEALRHPRWKMGPKVTVDSATLMNKGLEVIETKWLFDIPASQIEVLVHPESIIHSMVEYMDGSIIAQLGATDMRIPIGYALAYPERISSGVDPVDFAKLGALSFEKADVEKFPLLQAAYQSLDDDLNCSPIILNAADEVAVSLFLSGSIPFGKIAPIVMEALNKIPPVSLNGLDEIEAFHNHVTQVVMELAPNF